MSRSNSGEPRWSEVTAVFGGTFDPPHRGHLEAIRGLLENPGVGRVLVLPSGQPALKTTMTPAEDRVAMLERTLDPLDHARVSVDLRETRRSGPSYTFDTLQELRAEARGELAFVVGTDQLAALPRWHRFPELLGLSHWIVIRRNPDTDQDVRTGLDPLLASGLLMGTTDAGVFKVRGGALGRFEPVLRVVRTEAPALASTEIRRQLALQGAPPEGAMEPSAERYLKEKRLYGTHV